MNEIKNLINYLWYRGYFEARNSKPGFLSCHEVLSRLRWRTVSVKTIKFWSFWILFQWTQFLSKKILVFRETTCQRGSNVILKIYQLGNDWAELLSDWIILKLRNSLIFRILERACSNRGCLISVLNPFKSDKIAESLRLEWRFFTYFNHSVTRCAYLLGVLAICVVGRCLTGQLSLQPHIAAMDTKLLK